MKPYPLGLEISGPIALWARPDTMPSLGRLCAPVQFHRYTTNYGGPLRASDAMNKGAFSLAHRMGEGGRRTGEGRGFAVVLVNVCYRLYAQAEFAGHHDGTTWPPHAYHDVFNRALEATPCPPRPGRFPSPLWGEGVRRTDEVRRTNCPIAPGEVSNLASGRPRPFRPETRVCEIENHELPTMLRMVFDQLQNGVN